MYALCEVRILKSKMFQVLQKLSSNFLYWFKLIFTYGVTRRPIICILHIAHMLPDYLTFW